MRLEPTTSLPGDLGTRWLPGAWPVRIAMDLVEFGDFCEISGFFVDFACDCDTCDVYACRSVICVALYWFIGVVTWPVTVVFFTLKLPRCCTIPRRTALPLTRTPSPVSLRNPNKSSKNQEIKKYRKSRTNKLKLLLPFPILEYVYKL